MRLAIVRGAARRRQFPDPIPGPLQPAASAVAALR